MAVVDTQTGAITLIHLDGTPVGAVHFDPTSARAYQLTHSTDTETGQHSTAVAVINTAVGS